MTADGRIRVPADLDAVTAVGDEDPGGLDPAAPHLPIGVQIIAAPWREDLCLRVAQALETAGVARAPIAQAA